MWKKGTSLYKKDPVFEWLFRICEIIVVPDLANPVIKIGLYISFFNFFFNKKFSIVLIYKKKFENL